MLGGILYRLNRRTTKRFFRLYSKMRVKVSVKQGIVVGQEGRLPSGFQYESFLGIPYAVPPLGKLRFRSPVPLERFDTPELDCSKEGDVSHQRDPMTQEIVGSENSLFLNIYAPKKSSTKSAAPLPVMVWIHGGGFWFGNGNSDYHFPAKLMEQEVIVVTMNYRLGALGFLCLPEAGIYGNAGLKDQRLALQWLQENIASFNGDPNNVTLFGESAGAASVHLHAYAQHSNKLFHKVITQSGTANMAWVFQQQGEYKAKRLAELMGCNGKDTHAILEYLQSDNVTPLKILANTLKVLTPDERRRALPLAFKPVVEDVASPDSFINANILELMYEKDRLRSLPILMGYTSAEGIAMVFNARRKLDSYENDLARLIPRTLVQHADAPETQEVTTHIRDMYFNGKAITPERLDNLVDLQTDFHFNIDLQQAVEIHVHRQPSSPLYFYRFDYLGGRNLYKRILQCEDLRGACHGDELFYLFQMAGDETPVAKEDALMSERLCQMWANFAREGRPAANWTPVQQPSGRDSFQLDYFRIDRDCEMQRNPDSERIQFWRSMYKKYKPNPYEAIRAKL